jgi:hypothetical protein
MANHSRAETEQREGGKAWSGKLRSTSKVTLALYRGGLPALPPDSLRRLNSLRWRETMGCWGLGGLRGVWRENARGFYLRTVRDNLLEIFCVCNLQPTELIFYR